jgi:ribosomal 50S subunit-recycling heat shock protein
MFQCIFLGLSIAIQAATEEADKRLQNHIGPIHLFLALCKNPDEITRQVLDQQQLPYDAVVKLLFGAEELLASTSSDAKVLDLSGTDITELPPGLRHFTFLETLDVSHNRLTEIPGWLQSLPNLKRLDQLLVERGLCESREKARRAIMAGQVRVNQQVVSKASQAVRDSDEISLAGPEKFVSRGGFKLDVERVVLDEQDAHWRGGGRGGSAVRRRRPWESR